MRGSRLSRRRMLVGLGTASAAFALGACVPAAPAAPAGQAPAAAATPAAKPEVAAKGEVTIAVWVWPNNDKVLEDLTPDFSTKNPGIKLDIVPTANDYHVKLLTTLAAGEGVPDVAMVEISQVALFASKGGFTNLLDFPFNAGDFKDGFAPAGWAMGLSPDKRLIVMPKNMGTGVLFYRPALFEKAGVKPEEALKTWDDFIATGAKLTVADKQWMIDAAGSLFKPVFDQGGYGWFDEAGKLKINTPEGLRAMQVASQARKAGIDARLAGWTPAWFTSMKDSSVATYISGSWLGNTITGNAPETKGTWRIMPVPADAGKPRAVNIGGDFMGIPEKAKYKDEAWKLIKYVCTDTDSLINMWKSQQLWPWYIKNADNPGFNQPDPLFGDQVLGPICAQVAKDLPVIVTNPNDPIASQIVNDEVALVLEKDKEPAQALADAEKAILDKVKV